MADRVEYRYLFFVISTLKARVYQCKQSMMRNENKKRRRDRKTEKKAKHFHFSKPKLPS